MVQVKRDKEAILFERKHFDEFDLFRKPNTGMLQFALSKFNPNSPVWVIGDRPEDAKAAAALGLNFRPTDIGRARFKGGDGVKPR